MASHSLRSRQVVLHESDVTPQPLRIIKRSKTISGSTASGETLYRGRSPSCASEQSEGSSPSIIDKPLTVGKLRKKRDSILKGGFDGPSEPPERVSTISELLRRQAGQPASPRTKLLDDTKFSVANEEIEQAAFEEDPDITPKANKQAHSRTTSVGSFLKSEVHRQKDNLSSFSVRGTRDLTTSSLGDYIHKSPEPFEHLQSSLEVPGRRFSRSKGFLLRAIGGRNNTPAGSLRRSHTSSKGTLIRRFSRGKDRPETPAPLDPSSYEDSRSSCSSHFKPGSNPNSHPSIASSVSSSRAYVTTESFSSNRRNFPAAQETRMLGPRIIVTPEISSVDAGSFALWIAIEVHGELRNAVKDDDYEVSINAPSFIKPRTPDTQRYGYLHSMRIDLLPAHDCHITELLGDLHDANPLQVGETRLILAKINLCRTMFPSHSKESSDELIADLENDLGDTLTHYLTVRLSYKHSGFTNWTRAGFTCDGLRSHATQLQTEAKAVIRRHNSLSAWSPRPSQSQESPLCGNPLLKLINMHLTKNQADEAIQALSSEQRPIRMVRRFAGICGSSEETVKPFSGVISPTQSSRASTTLVHATSPRPFYERSAETTTGLNSTSKQECENEIDPARKIWTEMRRDSRCHNIRRPRHGRVSISADQFHSVEEYRGPIRDSSISDNSASTIDSTPFSESGIGSCTWRGLTTSRDIEDERKKIKETALKNKRSMGADTLRSIAPSTKSQNKPKGGALSNFGLGLGTGSGRTWGWGPPWW